MIFDNFLNSFDILNRHARSIAEFSGVENPADGVVYPDVTIDIPDLVRDEIQTHLDRIFERPVHINTMFMRLTSDATFGAPHQAHTDSVMGEFTLLLYLNDESGGTSLVRHVDTGMDRDPETNEQYEAWVRDTNVPDAWEITEMVQMRKNRANIIDAHLMHRAEPVGGFGDGQADGRIVLTAFFQ